MKTIKIKDYYGIYQEIPVSDELYEEWRALQNETQRIHRKEVYHRDWTPMDDLEEMPQHFTLNELDKQRRRVQSGSVHGTTQQARSSLA